MALFRLRVCAVVRCYGGRAGGDAAAAGAALTQDDSCSGIGPCDAWARAALEPARLLGRWESKAGRNGPCTIAAAPHAVIVVADELLGLLVSYSR